MSEKTTSKIVVSIFFIVLFLIFFYFLVFKAQPKNFIEIEGLYDEIRQLIATGLQVTKSVVGGFEGVKYVKLRINVKNRDKIPLNIYVDNMIPREVLYSKPTETIRIGPGEMGMWITGFIDVTPYEGLIQDFCATIKSEEVSILRGESEANGCISIKIDPEALSDGFQVQVDSNIGTPIINPSCSEQWSCSDWGVCFSGSQSRTCEDLSDCGTMNNIPVTNRLCTQTTTEKDYQTKSGIDTPPTTPITQPITPSTDTLPTTETTTTTQPTPTDIHITTVCLAGRPCETSYNCGLWFSTKASFSEKEGVCSQVYAPVCGNNEITYSNLCSACNSGVSTAKQGACQTTSTSTTGTSITPTVNTESTPTTTTQPPQESPVPSGLLFSTNAVGGNYKKKGVWIKVGSITYTYKGYSSYKCKDVDIILRTPENYPVCVRSGYDISERLYLYNGRYGLIFKA